MQKKNQSGFSLVELLLVMSLFAILVGIATLNLSNVNQTTTLTAAVNTFITDAKQQQIKAMIGDTEGRATSDNYGIYLGTSSYTLFHGTYSSGDSTNFVIQLPGNMQFTNVTFPSSQILFLKGGGEISGFTNGSNTVTIKDTTSPQQKTIQFNTYGIVTGIN